jgi:hypothetical protein
MTGVQLAALILVAVTATAVVFTPRRFVRRWSSGSTAYR